MKQDWKILRLNDVAELERKTIMADDIISGTTFIGLEHIDNEGNFTFLKSVQEGELNSNKFKFTDNHILYGKLRPYLKKIVRPNFSGICSTDILPIRPKENINRDYLYYYLRQPKMIKLATERCSGANLPRLSPSQLLDFLILVPLLPEQKRIAAIFDKADAIRKKRQETIRLLDEFLRSVFLEMFGDPVRNEKGWRKSKLGLKCNVFRGGSPRPINKFLGGTIPWIKIGDATSSDNFYLYKTKEHIIKDGVSKSRFVKKGSLIFANCGVSLGFARILKIDGCIHDGWLSFENISNDINSIYLLKLLNHFTNYFRKSAPDGTPNLNTTIMKEFEIIIPPIALQDKFALIIEKTEQQKQLLEKSLAEMENNFNSLMQRAFRGEL
jgi:type I restriction enzyme S subunit